MEVYWRHRRRGQNLVLDKEDDGHEEEIGGFRETKRGIDAYAKTFSYDPGRSEKGFPTIEDAKAFVESFKPWELFENTQGLTVDPVVRPAVESGSASEPSASEQPAESGTPAPAAETATTEQPADSGTSEPLAEPATPVQPAEMGTLEQVTEAGTQAKPAESIAPSPQPGKRWWEFWKTS